MVDKNIGKKTMEIFLEEEKNYIPPLAMQDNTLGISECGVKTATMNAFLNVRTDIISLQ